MIQIDIDMPKGCDDCIFASHCHECEGFTDKCILTGREYPVEGYRTVYPKDKPYWCPLEEEKGKPPLEPIIATDHDSPAGSNWYVCPACKISIDYLDRFCRHCGRALKW